MTTLQRIAARLVREHGSLRNAAKAVGIDHAYLHRLRMGLKTEPSDEVLAKLGLERRVIYRPLERGKAP